MASTMPKQLGELLQEQQEPFILEPYLFEKEYVRNKFNSQTSFRCCSTNSSCFLKRSASWGDPNKRRKAIPSCSKIAKALFNKLVSISNQKVKNSVSGDRNSSIGEIGKSCQETAESDRFSSASNTTVFNSFSESDTEDGPNSLLKDSISVSDTADTCLAFKLGSLPQEKEVVTDRKLQWRCREDNKELSPVSVLEEIASNEDSPVHDNRQQNSKIPFSKFIVQTSMVEPSCACDATASEGLSRPDPSSQYLAAKRVLQQSKQLLFDCVREMVETCVWKDRARQQYFLGFPGPEELEKLLCKDMRIWSKCSGNESNTTQLLNSDFMASVAEWGEFGPQVREIGAEIGDAILEDIISNDIVVDMTELG